MSRIKVGRSVVAATIERLQDGGRVGHERAVLWLGHGAGRIDEVYEPRQRTRADQFYFDRESMQELLAHLRQNRMRVVAQVHSHPGRAFHSEADNEWAIVRDEVYEPRQRTRADQFYFDRESMQELLAHLRQNRMRVVAQVHSHPGRAFHSEADNEWAIVRHAGALSLVLPRFAQEATVDNFLSLAVTYVLSTGNDWEEALGASVLEVC